VHRGKLILYGCGDLINDYEGIAGMERYRGDLSLLYFPTLEIPGGCLRRLEMVPMGIRRMRLSGVGDADREWLRATLDREAGCFGGGVVDAGRVLELRTS
jgi:poly-gamma-glutamate synthesis protein (capsule biosynthesis protein)